MKGAFVLAIGFRSFPDGFSFVVLDGTQAEPELISHQRLRFPKNASWGASLAWIRKQITELLHKHQVSGACIKGTEPVARKKSGERLSIEGVITEALYSIARVDCGTRIKSQLKRDIRDFTEAARYLDQVLQDSNDLSELNSPNFQEAALAAIAELPLE